MEDLKSKVQIGNANPLAKHFRTPKIYLNLPSKGKWYPEGSLELPENGEVPVYSMTAKDELAFKTPDALLNGSATVGVIQSCVPAIKNAWHVPSVDLDAILIAIRIATYGEKLEINAKVPNTEIEKTFDLDLNQLLTKYVNTTYEEVVQAGDFKVGIRPMDYRQFTETAIKSFEEQRLFNTVNDSELKDEEKIKRFYESFEKLNEMNVGVIANCIQAVQYKDEDPVTSPQHIREFIENADRQVFGAVKDHIEKMRERFNTEPIDVESSQEERDAGAPATYKVPVVFDQANFFVSGS